MRARRYHQREIPLVDHLLELGMVMHLVEPDGEEVT